MEYKILEKPAFTVVGKAVRVKTEEEKNLRIIPEFWDESVADGTVDIVMGIAKKSTQFKDAILGVCADFSEDMSEFTYIIAAEGAESEMVGELASREIPGATWAVFSGAGQLPRSIQELWGRIWSEFFAAGEYKPAPVPNIEVYPPGDTSAPDYRFEVWISVVKA